MLGYQSQRDQEDNGTSYQNTRERLYLHGSSDERTQPVQLVNVDLETPRSERSADSSGRPFHKIGYDDGIPDQYRPNFCVDGYGQTYRDQTVHPQTQTSNHAPIDLSRSLQAHSDPNTLSDSDLFWVKYHHGANLGRDLFPRWKGLQTHDLPPRETVRLIPNEARNLPHLHGKLQILKGENGEHIRSELTDEHLYELPFLPRYIDMKTDATTKNIDNWIIMGADLRRDIIPRSMNYNPYYSFDENGDEFFDWKATAAHLQRTYTNKHMKRAEQLHVMGGLLRKFRMDKGRFAEFLTPITFDEQGNQRRMLLNMENLLFNTRWEINLDRMVMRNPHSHQELPLFTPVEVRPQVRECLEKMLPHERVPTLHDLFTKYPHVRGYDERNHPLFRRSEELDSQLRRNWEMEAARRGNRRPPVTVTKPNYAKGRKEITAKRRKSNTPKPESNTLDVDGKGEEDERPAKRTRKSTVDSKLPPRRKISKITGGKTKRPPRLPRSPLPPHPPHPSLYSVNQNSQHSPYSTYQETPLTATFHEASPTQMDLLLQPIGDSNLVPEELLYHHPINCFDENGVFVQILISQYYAALTIDNRQMYRKIRNTQGLEVAKRRLLETFGLQQTLLTPPMASGHAQGNLISDQFVPMTGANDPGIMRPGNYDRSADFKQPHHLPLLNLLPAVPMSSFQDIQDYKWRPEGEAPNQPEQLYDAQLFSPDTIAAFNQRQECFFPPNTGIHPLLNPWLTDETFPIDNLGAQVDDGVGHDRATNLPLSNDNFTGGMDFGLDADQLNMGGWGQFDDSPDLFTE
ncbi:hypothetical protein E6O75_ATG09017 [Venturia nashicola]|uniref:Uncharacterized protein n=1 Tax=Venturia nashicola TaxID=86259 RepID=A0A4Z1NXQ6_9PEZI|nr:hypothetical protein E6O75_ATG09017 [Venturia nashicola]